MSIFDLLRQAVKLKASDVHITVGAKPIARVKGKFIDLNDLILTKQITKQMTKEIARDKLIEKVENHGEADFSASLETGERFRVNAYKQKGNYAIAIRTITAEIPTFEQLGLPETIKNFTQKYKGLVLVTGPTGSGKSTTLASMINIINENQQKHIITLEDPIEYVHNHKRSLVNQREVGTDTESFNVALRAILRQDPDVILIGEMRDPETVSIALTAAETGHLVFSTLHTMGASKTIDRIVDMFEPAQQQQIRTQLSTVCEGVISQQLIPSIDEESRVVALEIMMANPAIKNLIREGKTYQIPNVIQTSTKQGMKTMDQDLIELSKSSKISRNMALSRSTDPDFVNKMLGGLIYNGIYN
ncbi:type IV pilus twitching motility protein PilT [Romboutsia maritimum]|uniref:Type IV pilus twitching motility protein PilT n=1 Tax=Romboutsia maritimum TaxID=2020948 RepID=A0A371ISZ8_9FIRM|nr:type IV pilus twitching motility protein PilT [Romboutsia maritimum]RDY23601.1 type IV pilus twitching motility protein PilT [Romboutsia maritimum]